MGEAGDEGAWQESWLSESAFGGPAQVDDARGAGSIAEHTTTAPYLSNRRCSTGLLLFLLLLLRDSNARALPDYARPTTCAATARHPPLPSTTSTLV
jgi:hypothetical protein